MAEVQDDGYEPITDDPLANGSLPVAVGQVALLRIPIPGTNGLAIEMRPRGWVPKTGSTSTLFFQDLTGKRHLRLDWGYNVSTQTYDYHWNQKGVANVFHTPNHTPAGPAAGLLHQGARYFRDASRRLMIFGAGVDLVTIVAASNPIQRATEVVSAWVGAWAGCKVVGAGGAFVGSFGSPLGTAIGGIGGCIIGGLGGYHAGEAAGRIVYQWAESTLFTPLQETGAPG